MLYLDLSDLACAWLLATVFVQTDAILSITTTCICGSDLHMYVGFMPGVKPGDVMGHEFMGIVESVGSEVKNLKPGENCEARIEPNCKACMEPIYHCCYVCH